MFSNYSGEINFYQLFAGGILGSILGYGISRFHDFIKRRCKYLHYRKIYKRFEGLYHVYEKYDKKYVILYKIQIKRKKNVFEINGVCVTNNEIIEGCINVSNDLEYYGRGYFIAWEIRWQQHLRRTKNGTVS